MPSVQDIMLLCRLCSVKDKVTVPIFGEDDANDIPLKISACLPVKVSLEDNLPKKICDTCLNKLESLYQFWNEAANTERKFLDWLSQDELIADDDSPDAESSEFDSMTIKREEELIDVPDVNFSDVKSLSADPIAITKQIEDLESTNSYEPPFKRSKTDDNVVPIQRAEDNKDISSLVITSTIDIDSETKTEKESENALDQSELQNFVPVDEELQPGTSGIVQPVNEETCNITEQQDGSNLSNESIEQKYSLKKCVVFVGDLDKVNSRRYMFVNKTLDQLKSNSLNVFKCPKCGTKFSKLTIYIEHLITGHQGEKPCKFCNVRFDDESTLKVHVQEVHPYNCERCCRIFMHIHQALLHAKLHNLRDKVGDRRSKIPSKAPKDKITRYVNSASNQQKNYCCTECDSRFEDCYQLQRHCVAAHKKKPEKRYDWIALYKCLLCPKHYPSEQLLEEHKKSHLIDIKSVAEIPKELETEDESDDDLEDRPLIIDDSENEQDEKEPLDDDPFDGAQIICNDIEFANDDETQTTENSSPCTVQNPILEPIQTQPSQIIQSPVIEVFQNPSQTIINPPPQTTRNLPSQVENIVVTISSTEPPPLILSQISKPSWITSVVTTDSNHFKLVRLKSISVLKENDGTVTTSTNDIPPPLECIKNFRPIQPKSDSIVAPEKTQATKKKLIVRNFTSKRKPQSIDSVPKLRAIQAKPDAPQDSSTETSIEKNSVEFTNATEKVEVEEPTVSVIVDCTQNSDNVANSSDGIADNATNEKNKPVVPKLFSIKLVEDFNNVLKSSAENENNAKDAEIYKIDLIDSDDSDKGNSNNSSVPNQSENVIEINSSSDESKVDKQRPTCALCHSYSHPRFLTMKFQIYICVWCSYVVTLATNKLELFDKFTSPLASKILRAVAGIEKSDSLVQCNVCKMIQQGKEFSSAGSLVICNYCQTKISKITRLLMEVKSKRSKEDCGQKICMVKCCACKLAKSIKTMTLLNDVVLCERCWSKVFLAATILSSLYNKAVNEDKEDSDGNLKIRCCLCSAFKRKSKISICKGTSLCDECRINFVKLVAVFNYVMRKTKVCLNCLKLLKGFNLDPSLGFCGKCVLSRPNACSKCDKSDRLGQCICDKNGLDEGETESELKILPPLGSNNSDNNKNDKDNSLPSTSSAAIVPKIFLKPMEDLLEEKPKTPVKEKFTCSVCNTRINQEDVVLHAGHLACRMCKLKMENTTDHFVCFFCSMVFDSKEALNQHKLSVHLCSICKKFRENVAEHQKLIVKCQICEIIFCKKLSLGDHYRKKHDLRWCASCNSVLRDDYEVLLHRKTVHNQT